MDIFRLWMLGLVKLAADGGADGGAGGSEGDDGGSRGEGAKDGKDGKTGSEGGTGGEGFDPSTKLDNRVKAKYETQLKKEYQNDDFTGIEDLNKLYEGYKKGKSDMARAVVIPGPESTSDETKAFFQRIGMPQAKEGYELQDYDLDPSVLKDLKARFQEQSFRMGLSKNQAKGMWQSQCANYASVVNQLQAISKDAKDNYDKRYDAFMKETYPDDTRRERRITAETNLYKAFIAETGLGAYFERTGLIYNPEFIHTVACLHEKHHPEAAAGSHVPGLSEEAILKNEYPSMFKNKG